MERRTFVLRSCALASGLPLSRPSWAAADHGSLPGFGYPAAANFGYPGVSIVVAWNRALLTAIAATSTQATIAARACSMLHEAIYNAWAVWDRDASFTLPAMRKAPYWGKSPQALASAISWAASIVLTDLFPSQAASFAALLAYAAPGAAEAGYAGLVLRSAREAGQLAGNSLLQKRHPDGSNQLGDLAAGVAYADTSGYVPVNSPDRIVDIRRWQPLRLPSGVVQSFLTPHWGRVQPFALSSGAVYRPPAGPDGPSPAEMDQLIAFSAGLNDATKSLVDLWAANPGSVSPPGQWMQIAEQVSACDANSLDQDVRLFFGAAQAVHDAAIAAWDTKRTYDTVRPITAIPYFYADRTIVAWAGFDQGVRAILGRDWRPYQRTTSPTPPFPEFVSGHSTFSAAAAAVLAGLRRGGNDVTITGSVPAGGIGFETNTPAQAVTYRWTRLSDAADSAGLSRRYGGIHFERGDLGGRELGRKVGGVVLAKCRSLFSGYWKSTRDDPRC